MKTYGDTDRVIGEIRAERNRQQNDEGWTPEHDDAHVNGEMASAAACYAIAGNTGLGPADIRLNCHEALWPWEDHWWKPRAKRRNLIRAAALIVAEIERLDRANIEKLSKALPKDPARQPHKGAQMSRGKPILCLDFDGVVHSYTSGWKGADNVPDPPVDGAITFMLGALREFDVVIFSSRSNQPGGIAAMRDWLYRHAGTAWYESPDGLGIESVRFVTEKPPALVTIDDRVILFEGLWPSLQTIKEFRPWNKRTT